MVASLYPENQNQTNLVYIVTLIGITVTTAFFVWRPLAFLISLLWTALLLWDIVLKPALYPEAELSEQERIEAAGVDAFSAILSGEADNLKREMGRIQNEVNELKKRNSEK